MQTPTPSLPHHEHHFESSDVVRDIVIGLADGLTVPFALAAGLAGAVDSGHLVIIAGRPDIGQPDWHNVLPGRPMNDEEVTDVVEWLASQRAATPSPAAEKGTGGLQ